MRAIWRGIPTTADGLPKRLRSRGSDKCDKIDMSVTLIEVGCVREGGGARGGRGGIVCGPPLDGENEQRDDLDARGFRSALSGSKTARAFACTTSMSSAPTWHCGSDGDGERPARGGLRSYERNAEVCTELAAMASALLHLLASTDRAVSRPSHVGADAPSRGHGAECGAVLGTY